MNIVTISHRNKNPLNYRINTGFYNKLSTICKNYTMVDAYDKSKGIIHSPEYIVDNYNPDVVICHAHHPYLQGYFKHFKCLKVMVAVDSWKKVLSDDTSFYTDNEFDLILYRSSYDENFHSKIGIEGVWLPFSACSKEFHPDESIQRRNIIGFAGSYPPSYKQRTKAINMLKKANLLDFKGKILGSEYAKYLRSITVGLTSAQRGCVHGKVFEMMASGTVVLSPYLQFDDILFEKNCYIGFEHDCSDIVDKSLYILKNKQLQRDISDRSYKCFLERHTDDIRIREMYDHIDRLARGRPINKVWGK